MGKEKSMEDDAAAAVVGSRCSSSLKLSGSLVSSSENFTLLVFFFNLPELEAALLGRSPVSMNCVKESKSILDESTWSVVVS
ncbi:hypothetical protein WICPIJ_008808 [Wickerhamomyces pijperi]|uniref:Uncharacterized protein n=1 Tax=Wickerhamomyces pijperi TaxID=599730 RepID=A0A9P8PV45_WICPI|nr:hypothetical protein WICPIJ_008808 [Wickerhamomyces pijperi]